MKIHVNRNNYRSASVFIFLMLCFFVTASESPAQISLGRGGGSSPTPTPTPVPVNPLPRTPPEPGVLYRESFGFAELFRPTGGKGTMKQMNVHTNINSYWIEYPGSKTTQWTAPQGDQTWSLCQASENPYEMFSPLQVTYGNGCVGSFWFDTPTANPTALMAVTLPTTAYEVSFNGYPAPIAGKYLALGLTNSPILASNLETSGAVVLVLRPVLPWMSATVLYELRAGGMNGTLLASGETYFDGWNQMKIKIDPVVHTVGGSVNGTDLGIHSLDIGRPRYAGFEGVGIGDNFVIRTVQ
ncbi:MAG: hypothetical protein ABL959_09970 [Pyrinomonadaceae bacterium]